MTTIFIVGFVKNAPELFLPYVMQKIKEKNKKIDEKPVVHAFNEIDKYIEEQFDLEPY